MKILLSFLAVGTAMAASAQEVSAPALRAEDSWKYRETVERRPSVWKQSHIEMALVRSSADSLLVTTKEEGSTNPPREQLFGVDWSRFRNINGKEMVVNRPLMFPLLPGKTWNIEYTESNPNGAHKSETFQTHYTVSGWEDVDVPAGKFKALKIEADGKWVAVLAPKVGAVAAAQAGAQGTATATQTINIKADTVTGRIYKAFWYAPEVKRFVKSTEEYFDAGGERNERFTDELESYKVN